MLSISFNLVSNHWSWDLFRSIAPCFQRCFKHPFFSAFSHSLIARTHPGKEKAMHNFCCSITWSNSDLILNNNEKVSFAMEHFQSEDFLCYSAAWIWDCPIQSLQTPNYKAIPCCWIANNPRASKCFGCLSVNSKNTTTHRTAAKNGFVYLKPRTDSEVSMPGLDQCSQGNNIKSCCQWLILFSFVSCRVWQIPLLLVPLLQLLSLPHDAVILILLLVLPKECQRTVSLTRLFQPPP